MNRKDSEKKFFESIDLLSQEMARIEVNNNKSKFLYEIEQDLVKGTKRKKYKRHGKDIINFSSDSDENDMNLSFENSFKNDISIKSNNNKNKASLRRNSKKNTKNKKKSIFINRNSNINNKNNFITKNNNEQILKSSSSNKENENISKTSNKKLKKVSFAPNKIMINEDMNINKNNINNNKNEINNNNINNINNIINNIKIENNKKDDSNIIKEENPNYINRSPIHKSNTLNKNLTVKISSIFSKKMEETKKDNNPKKEYMDINNILPLINSKTNQSTNYIPKLNLREINKDKLPTILKNNQNSSREENSINYTNNKEENKSLFYNLSGKNKIKKRESESGNENDIIILGDDPEVMMHEMDSESNVNVDEEIKSKISRDNSRKNTVSSFAANSNFDSSLSTSNNNNKTINNSFILNYYKNEENSKGNNFFKKQIKRQKYTELKIDKKRKEKELKESMNYYSIPKINSFSNDLVIVKGNYIPLFKRAIELENERKAKILINQRLKDNIYFYNNKSNLTKRSSKQISEFYYEQMEWRDKIDKKNNYLKNILEQKERENDSEIRNYEMKIDPKSKLIIRTKRQKDYYYSKNGSNTSRNTTLVINYSANRLYKDYQLREKKLKKLKNELTPTFKPIINEPLPFYSSRTQRKKNIDKTNKKINEISNDNSYLNRYKKSRSNPVIKVKPKKSRNTKDLNLIGKKYSTFSQHFSKRETYFKSTNVDSKNTKTNSADRNNSELEKIKENSSSNKNSSSLSVSQNNNKDERNNKNIDLNVNNNKSINKIRKENDKSQQENPINKSIKMEKEKENESEKKQNNTSYKENSKVIKKRKKSSTFKPIKKLTKNLSSSNIVTSLYKNNKIVKNFSQNDKQKRKSLANKSSKELLITNKFNEKKIKKKVQIVEEPKIEENIKINEVIKEENINAEKNSIEKQSNNLNEFFTNKFIEFKDENEIVNNSDLFENINEQPKIETVEEKKEIIESYEIKEEKSRRKLVKSYKFNSSDDDEEEQKEENEEEEESASIINRENKSNEWIKKLKEISKNEELRTEREKNEINRKKNGASTTRAQTKRIDSDRDKERERISHKKNVINDEDKLYILNYRNSSSTANYQPYTFTAKDPIFYKFFMKQK